MWTKVDTKDGITVARCKFGRDTGGMAIMKVEGHLATDPVTVHQFLQFSTKQGGKVCVCASIPILTSSRLTHSMNPFCNRDCRVGLYLLP